MIKILQKQSASLCYDLVWPDLYFVTELCQIGNKIQMLALQIV